MKTGRLTTVVGARPQFVKAAAVSHSLRAIPEIDEIIVHTGQHYDREMSGSFFEDLVIPSPRYNLGVGSGSHAYQTATILIRLEKVLEADRPDAIIVYGDTNSTLAAALAASKLHIPVCHVEAGLRSHNRLMPEEVNRVVTDHLSDLLLCPSRLAIGNLSREGREDNVFFVGDVMFDCHRRYAGHARSQEVILDELCLRKNDNVLDYYLSTVHRAENTNSKSRMEAILGALNSLDAPVVLPLHPRTKAVLEEYSIKLGANLRPLGPVSYPAMQVLQRHARTILTDSGGLQREAFYSRVPCVTLRDETEWPEIVDTGWNIVSGAEEAAISAAVDRLRNAPDSWESPYGDGNAAELVSALLVDFLRERGAIK